MLRRQSQNQKKDRRWFPPREGKVFVHKEGCAKEFAVEEANSFWGRQRQSFIWEVHGEGGYLGGSIFGERVENRVSHDPQRKRQTLEGASNISDKG